MSNPVTSTIKDEADAAYFDKGKAARRLHTT